MNAKTVLGAVLNGGRSSRFGSDKAQVLWEGRPLIDHARQALGESCDLVVVCGGPGDGPLHLTDRPEADCGPLGGLCAALRHARDHGFAQVLCAPVDVHPLPSDLVQRLGPHGPAVLDDQWLVGLWPSALSDALERHLAAGHRSVMSWIEAAGATMVAGAGLGLVNLNRPEDLARLAQRQVPSEATETYAPKVLRLADDSIGTTERTVPVEVPVAIEFNGIGYAVMMATPVELEDFIHGFAIAEGLASAGELSEPQAFATEGGWVVRANVPAHSMPRLLDRARTRVSESSCGICGIDSIAAALAPLPRLERRPAAEKGAFARALAGLRERQVLGQATGAVHAAAFCAPDGAIVSLREDVGRHNAFDKLIGALAREGRDPAAGFAVLSARCSLELVDKAVRAGIPMLVTISAPTSLALARASDAGLTLLALARKDSALVFNDPHALFEEP